MGLAIARELRDRHPKASIVVLEKEATLGAHASGRNSGVLHSGIYYAENSLKARVCVEGARMLAAYCEEHRLPLDRMGKVILPVTEHDDAQLDLLYRRGKANGARVELIDRAQLRELEPEAHTVTGRALHSPDTAVIEPGAVLDHLARSLRAAGVEIRMQQRVQAADPAKATVRTQDATIRYGHLFNAAGLHADVVAHAFGLGRRYTILPFKGIYYKLDDASGLAFNGLVYPVPDLSVPLLGVHVTKKVDGAIYFGPTAVPALGRENYAGLAGLSPRDLPPILGHLALQYLKNKQGFRRFAHQEGVRFFKSRFATAARSLIPRLKAEHLVSSKKVGIRAQLLDKERDELVMDFLLESGLNSTHVLNAVSPAFTSAFSFARLVVDRVGVV